MARKRIERIRRFRRLRFLLTFGLRGGADEQGVWNPQQVMGHRSGRSEPIDSIDDSGTERLAVDAKVSGTAEVNLDSANDEVTIFGGQNGSDTPRNIVNVTSGGRVRSELSVGGADVSNSNPVPVSDAGGTLTVDQATAANLNAQAVGDVAHDEVDAGNPLKVGGKATSFQSAPGTVAAADRVDAWFDRRGRMATINSYRVTPGTPSRLAVTTSSQQAIASNAARMGLSIAHVSGTQDVLIGIGVTPVATGGSESFHIRLQPGEYYEAIGGGVPMGAVNVIASATGSAVMSTEYTENI